MGGPPPPPPPPPGMAGPPPPPPPPGFGGPPPPPPPPGFGGPPPPPGGGPPPPPGFGGPPPPPGFGGPAFRAGPATKKKWETNQVMKRIAWQKVVPMKVTGTFWEKANEETHSKKIDFTDFENLFAAKQAKKAAVSEEEKKPAKAVEQTCLDGKKQYNLSILLGRIKMTFPEIKAVFLKMDNTVFDDSILLNFQKYEPDNDELAALKDPPFPRELLSKADLFTEMMYQTIFHFKQRVEIMLYTMRFEERITDCQKDLDNVLLGSIELKTSKKFTQVLEIILLIGNYMNCSARSGKSSHGFKIDFLEKLANTKGNNNRTLLHHICKIIKEKQEDLLALRSELSHVAPAQRVSTQQQAAEKVSLERGIANIEKEITLHVDPAPDDKFIEFATNFVSSAKARVKKLAETMERMETAFQELIKFFADDPKKSSEEVFSVYNNFLTMYDQCIKDNEDDEIKAAKEKKKLEDQAAKKIKDEERKAARAAKMAAAKGKSPLGGGAGAKDGALMENMLSQLTSGAAFNKQREANSKPRRQRRTREEAAEE